MNAQSSFLFQPTDAESNPPSSLRVLRLIVRRAALEALRDRMTLVMSIIFAIVLPIPLVFATILPLASHGSSSADQSRLAGMLVLYVLIIGLMPSTAAVGIACGQFAGDREHGNLTPLLASPTSNLAIFGGKVLGAIVPGTLFAVLAEATYLCSLALFADSHTVHLLSLGLSAGMLAMIPATALFGATVASLISSRVRTFNTAQQVSGLAMVPLWGLIIGIAYELQGAGTPALFAGVIGLFALDVALAIVAAATWGREEVLAKL